jgi:hypothetical protein
MNIDSYNERCRTLAELASQAIELEGLDEKTKDELAAVRKNILANHYRITLLGSYQGGKSTIFDTACGGGRELSPTGFGIRTSAVPAEAHSINPGEKEHAIVIWKSDQDILSSFVEAISPELRDLNRENLKNASDAEIIDQITLDRPEDMELLRRAVADALRNIAAEREAPGTQSSTRSELLRIGELVLRHYEDFRMVADASVGRQTKVTVEEATRIVRFPESWHKPGEGPSYEWHEVRFLFARSVAFHVVSPDLSRLKAVLVDCPGLHASQWDNEIVHDCIAQSDAIIWLQGDQGRELGMSDIEEARRFADYGITSEGIFLAFNAKGVSKVTAERILESNLAKMKELAGLEVPNDRVAIFNALLALRCKQAQAVLAGGLTQETVDALATKARFQVNAESLPDGGKDREKNSHYLIKRDIKRQSDLFLEQEIEDPWSEETLSRLLEMSRWEDVIKQATQFIVETKGRTRLVNRGARPIVDAIATFEENLELSERLANQNLSDHTDAKKAAEKALEDFDYKVDGLLLPYARDLKHTLEADSGIGFGIRGELLARFKHKRAKNSLRNKMEAAIDGANQERDVQNAVRSAAVDWMKSIITGWQVDARSGKSAATKNFQHDEMGKLETTMREFLKSAVVEGHGLLGGVAFNIPEIEDQVLMGYQAKAMRNYKATFDWILDKTDRVQFLRPIRDGYEALRKTFTGSPFDKKSWKNRLGDYITELGEIIDEKVVEDVTRDFLSVYFEAITNQIKSSKKQMHKEFKSRIKTMEEELQKTQEERNDIAKQAKAIRKNVIKPFRERVETFIFETEAALPESS